MTACGSSSAQRDAYAVGGSLGNGSVFGAGPKCTYEVTPASAAELYESKEGGTLVGPGKGTIKCESGHTAEFDIVMADKITISGDHKLAVGKEGSLRVSVFGGGRELKTSGHWNAEWAVPADCAPIVKADVDRFVGADSLKGSYALEMTALAKGSCTVTASVLGHTAAQKITVQ